MPRSQEFGFHMENLVRKVHGLAPKNNDTCIHDIKKEENRFDTTETQSIKTSGGNYIDCGDVLRLYDYDMSEKHTMVLFRYDQLATTRKIREVIEIAMNEEFKNALFGSVPRAGIEALVKYVKEIPAGGRTAQHQATYKQMAKDLKRGWGSYAPKVDSKKQRRVQFSIRSLDAFLEKYPQLILSRTSACLLRGCPIADEHPFGRRVRNTESDS